MIPEKYSVPLLAATMPLLEVTRRACGRLVCVRLFQRSVDAFALPLAANRQRFTGGKMVEDCAPRNSAAGNWFCCARRTQPAVIPPNQISDWFSCSPAPVDTI